MASKSYEDGIEDPVLSRVEGRKEWRVGKRSENRWANCEIILEYNSKGQEKLTVVKDGVRVCSWTRVGFSIKPPRRRRN